MSSNTPSINPIIQGESESGTAAVTGNIRKIETSRQKTSIQTGQDDRKPMSIKRANVSSIQGKKMRIQKNEYR